MINAPATVIFLACACVLPFMAHGTEYYVSNNGLDTNFGTTPEAPWQTLERVNAGPFAPGDRVLFSRGGMWRGKLVPYSGNKTAPIYYGAYGEGEKPLLLGSIEANRPEDWVDTGGNIWKTSGAVPLPCDVGNIIFDGEKTCGVKVWEAVDLDAEGEYWFDEAAHTVSLFSSENPARLHTDIECALRDHIIDQGGRSYVTYENLALKYGAAHGIGGGGTHHIVVRDCDFGYIGGGDQMGGDRTVRFGNGVEFWAGAHDCLVERCRLWEIYDAALTNQSNAPGTQQYNIIYRNNIIWNCEYSFEYWNRPEDSITHDIYFVNNTCVNAGQGWGHGQRPDPSGRQLCFYSNSAQVRDFVVRNNIFFEAKANALFLMGWTAEAVAELDLDHNCWYQETGDFVLLNDARYSMALFAAYQTATGKDVHSIAALPQFLDAAGGNFSLGKGSPCIDAGADTGIALDNAAPPAFHGTARDIGAIEFRE
ncbi:MAG: hypothetical protein IT364_14035 [Candidatus Hydrogenedentes bacterium]|nr:hypothetical protein [Candidatus Hydrogenedentota bacterium]